MNQLVTYGPTALKEGGLRGSRLALKPAGSGTAVCFFKMCSYMAKVSCSVSRSDCAGPNLNCCALNVRKRIFFIALRMVSGSRLSPETRAINNSKHREDSSIKRRKVQGKVEVKRAAGH